ncbi:tape measure domain-containing protein [Acinetobacter baylyi]|nr:tape measure domain-containing protein [Acinetobacter baylyi]
MLEMQSVMRVTLATELDSIERKGNFANKSMDGLSVATRQLAGYMAGLLTIGTAVAKMDTYTGLQNRLKLVTASQLELNQALKDTFSIAQATGQAWDSTAQVYQRFADNAKRLGITLQQTAILTDTVAKAIAISGGSAASAEAALVQFGQALASGVLRGEEFNSIAEQAPGLLKAIASGLNVNIGQLRSMAAQGQLTADVVIKSLEKAKVSVDTLFGKTDFTIGQSLQMLSNSITQFVGEAGKGSGAAQNLSGAIQVLANNLGLIANSAFALGIGLMTKAVLTKTIAVQASIVASAQQLVANIAERNANIAAAKAEVESAVAEAQSTQVTLTNIKATHAQIMAEIELEKVRLKAQITDQGRMATTTRMAQLGRLQAQVALEVVAAEAAQSASSARLSAALTAQSIATSRLALAKSALMAMFSPMGLAIAATAASFYLLSNSSDEVKESLLTQSDSVETLKNKYLELNSVQALVEGVRLRKEIEQQKDAIDDARSATQRFAYIQKELFKLSGNDYADYQKAIKAIATGAGDAGDLLSKMIASGRFSQEQIDKLVEYSGAVAESKNKIEQGNNALKLLNATSKYHVDVTADSIRQLTTQTNLTKVATQNFIDMKTQMLDSLKAQVEFIRLNGGSEEQVKSLNKVIQAYSLNQMSATDAVSKFNSTAKVPTDVVNGLQDYATKTDQSKSATIQANAELNRVRAAGANAKAGFNDVGQGAKSAVQDVAELNNKLKDINKTLTDRKWDADFKSALITKYGRSAEEAELLLKTYRDNQKKGFVGVTVEQDKIIKGIVSQESVLNDLVNKDKERTKQLEKQQKILQVNAKVLALSNKYNISEKAAAANVPQGLIEGMIMQESRGDTYRKGKLLTSPVGAQGLGQFMPATAKQYGVDVRSEESSINGMIRYVSDLLKMFNGNVAKAVMAYNAGPENVRTGKANGFKETKNYLSNVKSYVAGFNGFSVDDISSKDFDKLLQDVSKMAEDQARLRLQLENDVASEVTKIRNDLAKKLEDVDKANFTPERKAEIKAELQARADNDVAIAQQALKTKLDDYKQFNMTEEQLLKDSFDRKKFNAAHDIELSKDQRDEAIKYLDQQYRHELALIKLNNAAQQASFDQSNLKALQELKQQRDLLAAPLGQRAGLSFQFDEKNALSENDNSLINKDGDYKVQLEKKEIDTFEYNRRIEAAVLMHEQNKLKIQEEFAEKYKNLLNEQYDSNLSYGEQITGSYAEIFKTIGGEQSKAFKVMFAAEKAFAIARSIMAIQTGIAEAAANPFPYNLAAMASVAASTASIISNIQSVSGIFHGGKDYVPKEATYLLDKGERVVSPRQNQDLTSFLASQREMNQYNAINSNSTNGSATVLEPIVNVYVLEGQTADVTRNNDGSLDVRIRQVARDEAERTVVEGYNNPNSKINKAHRQNYNSTPRRQ